MKSAPSTGTQVERGLQHETRVIPPLVGRPNTSEELGSTPEARDDDSTITVRVPGRSGDSKFYCETLIEDVKIHIHPESEALEAERLP